VTVAIRNTIRTGRMTKLDREMDEITVQFKDTNEELVFRSAQVRPQAWIKKSAILEANAQSSLENKRQIPLQSLEQPLSKDALSRPAVYWMEVRFVTESYALGSGPMTAIIHVRADDEEPDWEPGDQVEVMMDHMRRRDNWRRGTVMRILPEPESLSVRLEESNYRLIVTDRRFLRQPQPEPKHLPLESEVEFVDAVEEPLPQMSTTPQESEAKRMRVGDPVMGSVSSTGFGMPVQRPPPQQHPMMVHMQQHMAPSYAAAASGMSPVRAPQVANVPQPRTPIFPPGTQVLVRYPQQNFPGVIVKHNINPRTGLPLYIIYHEFNRSYSNDVDPARVVAYAPGPPRSAPLNQAPAGQAHVAPGQQTQQQPQHMMHKPHPGQQQPMHHLQQAQQAHMNQQQKLMHPQQQSAQQQQQQQQQQQHSPVTAQQQMMHHYQQHLGVPQQQQAAQSRMPYYGYPGGGQSGYGASPAQYVGQTASQAQQYSPQYGAGAHSGYSRAPNQQFVPSVLPPLSIPPIVNDDARGPDSPDS